MEAWEVGNGCSNTGNDTPDGEKNSMMETDTKRGVYHSQYVPQIFFEFVQIF